LGNDEGCSASVPTVKQVFDDMLVQKERMNRRPSYIRSLRVYLTQFMRGREGHRVDMFTPHLIESWFANRREAPITQASNLGRISALFSFAYRRGYIERNPCDRIERVTVETKPPRILTPREAGRLLCVCRRREPSLLAYVVLGMLAGIRPDELRRMKWSDVNWDRKTITVDASASKVRRRRIVPLEPKAVRWLKVAHQNSEAIAPCSVRRRVRRLAKRAGIKWSQDLMRHTAASYLYALHNDAGKLAGWLGNSPSIFLRHYRQLVDERDCARFWKTATSEQSHESRK
jgi:integrase/recombinase XerD